MIAHDSLHHQGNLLRQDLLVRVCQMRYFFLPLFIVRLYSYKNSAIVYQYRSLKFYKRGTNLEHGSSKSDGISLTLKLCWNVLNYPLQGLLRSASLNLISVEENHKNCCSYNCTRDFIYLSFIHFLSAIVFGHHIGTDDIYSKRELCCSVGMHRIFREYCVRATQSCFWGKEEDMIYRKALIPSYKILNILNIIWSR